MYWRNLLNALLGRDPGSGDLLPRLQAVEAAEQTLAEKVGRLEELLEETEETWAKIRRLTGRIYAMKRWDEVEDAKSDNGSDRAAVQRLLLRSKLGGKGE